jgi:hypothetical protein
VVSNSYPKAEDHSMNETVRSALALVRSAELARRDGAGRAPERIDAVLAIIADHWKQRPDLRLGELVHYAARQQGLPDSYGVEDAQLLIALDRRYADLLAPGTTAALAIESGTPAPDPAPASAAPQSAPPEFVAPPITHDLTPHFDYAGAPDATAAVSDGNLASEVNALLSAVYPAARVTSVTGTHPMVAVGAIGNEYLFRLEFERNTAILKLMLSSAESIEVLRVAMDDVTRRPDAGSLSAGKLCGVLNSLIRDARRVIESGSLSPAG